MAETLLFGDLLRQFRVRAGLPQEQVAERAGLSIGAVQSLEQGKRRAPYRNTVRALAEALNLASDETASLQDLAARARVRQHEAPTFLPITLTHFIDRGNVDELIALLRDRRLITVTGSGGVGKTRVGIEVARQSFSDRDVVGFVDLLPVRDGANVAAQIAARLGVGVSGDDGLGEVVERLRTRRTLLVIDNCEHLVRDVAMTVTRLLNIPSMTVLATSREPLGLTGELTYRLPPMDIESASKLFVARAQDADREWTVDASRLGVIAAICRELDGIPLAIELAASRVFSLGLDGVRSLLARGLALSGGPDLPLRHRTMQGAIAWSHDLLDDAERTTFRRLSAFSGSFTLEAAQDVASDSTLPTADVPEQLARLVQKSLLNATHLDTATHYRFLDVIRAFADERLSESGEREMVLAKLAARLDGRGAQLKDDMPATIVISHDEDLDDVGSRLGIAWRTTTTTMSS